MRANLKIACEAIVVDATKASATGKDLYLVMPVVAAAGGVDALKEAYNALLVPLIDRDGQAFLWSMRTHNSEGLQLKSYDSALLVLPRMVDTWGVPVWQGGGYSLDHARNQEALGEPKWPANLVTIDDWIEAAFSGKIIKDPDHKILAYLRGEI
jgi:hypothetical protein